MTGCLINHYENFKTIPRAHLQRPQGSMPEGANIHVNRMARPERNMLMGQVTKLKRNVDGANAWGFFPTDSPEYAVQYILMTSVPSESSHASIPGIYIYVILSLPPSLELQDQSSLLLNGV